MFYLYNSKSILRIIRVTGDVKGTDNDTWDEHQLLPAGDVSDTSQEENEAVVTSALGAATEDHINDSLTAREKESLQAPNDHSEA